MNSADNHPLNQGALQDFIDCPRRFELKYLLDTSWPGSQADPPRRFEELTEHGTQFHQICHQYFLGISEDMISSAISDPDLRELWERFLPYGRDLIHQEHFSEQTLRVSFRGYWLVAKYDYIARLNESDFLILDWKTSPKKPAREALASRIQTILYPFILTSAYPDLFPESSPGKVKIRLRYWYPLAEDPAEEFPYSPEIHEKNKAILTSLIESIDTLKEGCENFPLTEDLKRCLYCSFRSYCERGNETPTLKLGVDFEDEDLSSTHFDQELINEIEF